MSEGSSSLKRYKHEYCVFTHAFFQNAPLVHGTLGPYLEDDPYSYFSLARVTKNMWQFYCANDRAVIHMRYACRLANTDFAFRVLLDYSRIYTCVRWSWLRVIKQKPRVSAAKEFCDLGAQLGDLRIISMAVPWVDPPRFGEIVGKLVTQGHVDAALHFMENPPWVHMATWKDSDGSTARTIFLLICSVAHRYPRLYEYAQTFAFKKQFEVKEHILAFTLMNPLQHVKDAFGFFWNAWEMDNEERLDLVYRFLDSVFQQDRTRGDLVESLPQVFRAFFTPLLTYSESHRRDTLCFPNRDVFYMYVEQDGIQNLDDERIFHFVWWKMRVRYSYSGKLPALYCC